MNLPRGSLYGFLKKEFPACVETKKVMLKPVQDKSYFSWYFPDWSLQVENELKRQNKNLDTYCLSKTLKTENEDEKIFANRFSNEIVLVAGQIKIKYLDLPTELLFANSSAGFTEKEIYLKVQKYYSKWIKVEPYCNDNKFGGVLDSDSPSGIVYDKQKDIWFGERTNYC